MISECQRKQLPFKRDAWCHWHTINEREPTARYSCKSCAGITVATGTEWLVNEFGQTLSRPYTVDMHEKSMFSESARPCAWDTFRQSSYGGNQAHRRWLRDKSTDFWTSGFGKKHLRPA